VLAVPDGPDVIARNGSDINQAAVRAVNVRARDNAPGATRTRGATSPGGTLQQKPHRQQPDRKFRKQQPSLPLAHLSLLSREGAGLFKRARSDYAAPSG